LVLTTLGFQQVRACDQQRPARVRAPFELSCVALILA